MPRIEAIATALPPIRLTQEEVRARCEKLYAGDAPLVRLLRIFDHSGVKTRHFCFPPEYYFERRGFEERNLDYVREGTRLAERAARECLEKAGIRPDQVDHLFFITTTGLATPSLDALLAPRLGLRPDVRRWPLFGLGCAGGAGGLIRAADVLRGRSGGRALVVALELPGQVFSREATTPVDLVGAALFGDGCAAALVAGDDVPVPGPRITATGNHLFADSKDVMGWRFTSDGMRLVLSQDVASLVSTRLRPEVERFLGTAGLSVDDITHYVLHPGGRRILDCYLEAFAFPPETLRWTRDSLAAVGNLSSASVLFALSDVFDSGIARSGERGLVVALGPGFGAEMLVLEW